MKLNIGQNNMKVYVCKISEQFEFLLEVLNKNIIIN